MTTPTGESSSVNTQRNRLPDHHFDPEVAREIGIEEAILVRSLQIWIGVNRANAVNFHEGRTWTYNSIRAWGELIPYFSRKTLRRLFASLIAKKIVVTGQFHAASTNRELWYAFDDESSWLPPLPLPFAQTGKSTCRKQKMACPNGQMTNTVEEQQEGEEPAAPGGSLFLPGDTGKSPISGSEAAPASSSGSGVESPTTGGKGPGPGYSPNGVIEAWNRVEGVRRCLNVTDKRRRGAISRLFNEFFRDNWVAALEKVAASDFCRGANDRGWKADIDWFLQPDVVSKIMEGKYDNRHGTHRKTNGRGFEQQQSYDGLDSKLSGG